RRTKLATATAVTVMPRRAAHNRKGWSTTARHDTDFNALHQMFKERCAREGLSARSSKLYDDNLPKMYAYLRDVRKRKFWHEVTREDVEKFIEHYQGLDLSPHTKQQVFRNMKTLFTWMEDNDACKEAGLVGYKKVLPKFKKLKGRQHLPSPQQVQAFLDAFDK